MASHNRRPSSLVDPVSIEAILRTGETTPAAAAPSPRIGESPNPESSASSTHSNRPAITHGRALSYTPRRPNRLSLSFPVAPSPTLSEHGNSNGKATPKSTTMQSFPPTPADSVGPDPSPTDSNGFLVALASQERRVFELREELQKAEADLKHLKRQWSLHESYKKRAEIKHVEPMQPLTTVVTGGESDESAITTRTSAEMERRKTLLNNLNNLNIPKESRRKFSGAHTRALSLLSPERSNFPRPLPSPVNEAGPETSTITRSTTVPDTTSAGISKISSNRVPHRHSYQSGVTHNAKQIAEDIKSGMWTFLEDLRQATVGDEAINGASNRNTNPVAHPRKNSKGALLNDRSKQSARTRTWDSLTGAGDSLIDVSEPFWQGGAHSKTPATAKKISRPLSLAAPDLDDDWSSWDSPLPKSPRWSASSTLSDVTPATPSNGNVEDEDVQIQNNDGTTTPSKRDSLQWPVLEKLSPTNLKGNLQRTMSTLIKEWETITTPPGEEPEPAARQHERLVDISDQNDAIMMLR